MNIYVGNLYWEATEDDVEQLFAPYGTIARVQIITDRYTGSCTSSVRVSTIDLPGDCHKSKKT